MAHVVTKIKREVDIMNKVMIHPASYENVQQAVDGPLNTFH